jgi:hypothetical protein
MRHGNSHRLSEPRIRPRASRADRPRLAPSFRVFFLLFALFAALGLPGCRRSPVFEAERNAPVGNEFIRLYADGHAEYGFVVVRENLKAQGSYRYARDTVWFLSDSFKPHFPACSTWRAACISRSRKTS